MLRHPASHQDTTQLATSAKVAPTLPQHTRAPNACTNEISADFRRRPVRWLPARELLRQWQVYDP